ncbi:MAG: hypothetical protein ACXW0Z_17615 [Gemmatirosa sp.]
MATTNPTLARLADPLTAVTRAERKALLGTSAIGLVVVWTGLVPSKISALGVDFSATDQRALLRALAAIIGYFLVAFLSYSANDIVAWRTAFYDAAVGIIKEGPRLTEE